MTKNNGCPNRATVLGVIGQLVLTAAMAALIQIAVPADAAGPERMLAGISIFAPGAEVTAKFGNPSRILVGGVAPSAGASATTGTPGGLGSPGGYPGSASAASPPSPGLNPGAGLLPGFNGINTTALGSALNNALNGDFSGSTPAASSTGAVGAVPAAPPKQPVTLIYDRANGGSLEFTISPDKRVIQIRETGFTGAYGTSRGIKLGTTYAQVVAKYGYPEDTYIQGNIIDTDYKDTLHCGFQFLDQKLVAIIVVSPD